jgi:hypothetical protein
MQTGSVRKFATSYESDSEEESNPFLSKPAASAPALQPVQRMTSYGSDDEEEVNPFLTKPAAPASSGASAGPARFMNNYGSDEELEEDTNPFAAKPSAAGNAAPVPTRSMTNYGSDDDYTPRGSPPRVSFIPQSPTSPPPPRFDAGSRNPYEDSPLREEESDTEADMDPAVLRLMRVRDLAIELAGGLDVWDDLSDESIKLYMEQARQQYVD